jgi:hypothetical protein
MRTLEEAGTANAERIVASRLKDVPAKYRADKTVTDLGKHRQRRDIPDAFVTGQRLHGLLITRCIRRYLKPPSSEFAATRDGGK